MAFRSLTALAILFATVAVSSATPLIDSAVLNLRIFNDDADSILTTTNNYPSLISFSDSRLDGDGMGGEFANRHAFTLSANGGASAATFNNDDGFSFFSDVTISSPAPADGGPLLAEGGLRVSPWFSQLVDGTFTANAATGEVAVFGGRLPFYSFTANHGVNYVPGTTVRMGVTYNPNSLTMADPGTIQYSYTDNTGAYMSPVIAFDEGNPSEDPPYGLWGILNDARVGGYFQARIDVGNPNNGASAAFGNMVFVPEPTSVGLLLLGGAALLFRLRR